MKTGIEQLTLPACRRCSECRYASHHWLEGFTEDDDGEIIDPDDPQWQCKHCEFSMPYGLDDMDTEQPEAMYHERLMRGLISPPAREKRLGEP